MAEKSVKGLKDEMSLKELILRFQGTVRFLLGKWKIIAIAAIAGVIAGVTYAFLTPPQYAATATFVTDTDQNNPAAMSSYAGLAARFGVDLGNEGAGNTLFYGDNIYALMKTRRMLTNTLLSPVTIDGKKTLLIDRYIQMEKLRKKWQDNPHLKQLSFDVDTAQFTKYHYQVISSACKSLLAHNLEFPTGSGSSGNALMSVTLVSPDGQFSALFITNLIENVAQYYVSTTTKTARNTLHVLNKQLDSVRSQLYGAMSGVASFADRNINLVRQGPQVQQQKSTLKMQVNSAIYQQLVTAVETAKMTLQKETPLFEVVDKPILPLDQLRPGKVTWALIGLFAGIVLSCGCLVASRFYKSVMEEK